MMKKLLLAAVSAALVPGALAQSGLRETPQGFCSLGSLASAVKVTTTNCVFGSFTGVLAGNVLTVSSLTGSILPGQVLVGTGVAANTFITGQVTGTPGAAGLYQVNNAQTVASESMTTAGIPFNSSYAVICASTQAVNYRDDLSVPTGTAGSGGQFIPAAQCIGYNGPLGNLQFIQQAATAVLGISFYTSP